MTYFEIVGTGFLHRLPELVGWLIGLVLAVLMLKRGGGRAEKLFLAGCSLVVFVQLAGPFLSGFVSVMRSEGWRLAQAAGFLLLPLSILSLAGFICLAIAFILKFMKKRREPV